MKDIEISSKKTRSSFDRLTGNLSTAVERLIGKVKSLLKTTESQMEKLAHVRFASFTS